MKRRNPMMFKGEKLLTDDEVSNLKKFFQDNASKVQHLVTSDRGSSVIGNSIIGLATIVHQSKRRRDSKSTKLPAPRRVSAAITLFNNPWTQSEQPAALKALIKMALEFSPQLKNLIKYDPGFMD